jgi:hypothetical protein
VAIPNAASHAYDKNWRGPENGSITGIVVFLYIQCREEPARRR